MIFRCILHCAGRLYRVQSDSEGLSRWPHALTLCQLTPTTSPFLHGKICITAIATIASLCPRKEEKGRSWLPSKLVNILARVRRISAFGGLSLSRRHQSASGCGYIMKCFNLRAREKKEGKKKIGERGGRSLFLLFSPPVRGGGALRLMPAIRLCVANEESARHTH